METAIVAIICIALIAFGGMTMSQGFLSSVDSTSAALEQMGQNSETIMRTELTVISAACDSKTGDLTVTLSDSGQTKLASFEDWDVIVNYTTDPDYHVKWLPYTAGTPGADQWTVDSITMSDGSPESFELNILNPTERIVISGLLSPWPDKSSSMMVVVATPNGITASTSFTVD